MSDLHNLAMLMALRQKEVDRLEAELHQKNSLTQRYQRTINRLDHLCDSAGASASQHFHLSSNCAQYKLHLMKLKTMQMSDLSLHEADKQLHVEALQSAQRQHAVLEHAWKEHDNRHQQEIRRKEQKLQDDQAGQRWMAKQENCDYSHKFQPSRSRVAIVEQQLSLPGEPNGGY